MDAIKRNALRDGAFGLAAFRRGVLLTPPGSGYEASIRRREVLPSKRSGLMFSCRKLLPIGAVALAFAFAPAEAAQAVPATGAAIAGKSDASAVTKVQWGWGYRRYPYYRRGWGPGAWLG